jgi:hypothetical protein
MNDNDCCKERLWLPRVMFVFSLVFFAFLYGFLSANRLLPPSGMIYTAFEALRDLRQNWKNDIKLVPTRHLVEAPAGRQRLVLHAPDRVAPGDRLIAGLTSGRAAMNGAVLYAADGSERHYWPVDYVRLDPEGPDPENVMLHGLAVFSDGSIIVSFDEGRVLARLGPCGEIIWNRRGWYHHAVSASYDGTVWALNWANDSDVLEQLDPASGEVLQSISLMHDIILPHEQQGLFLVHYPEGEGALETPVDPFHTNDVEVLSPELAEAFPGFEADDLVISLRRMNLLAVLDATSHDVKWSSTGPWYRQHDPDFLPDGRIAVFDNNMHFGESRIVTIRPDTGKLETLFQGSDAQPFYTWRRGVQQHLDNGAILIAEAERGRVLEVDADGEIVWEFNNIYDDAHNGIVTQAIYLQPGFFQPGVLRCTGS